MSAYMKNLFPFYGLNAPLRNEISRDVLKKFPVKTTAELLKMANEMWQKREREWQYTAILLLAGNKKLWTENLIDFFGKLVCSKSWWDSVDGLSSNCIGPWFLKFPEQRYNILNKWESGGNMWLIRVCLIHQLSYRDKTDKDYLSSLICRHSDSGEFFIQKSIGWSLRQYAKFNPKWVRNFVDTSNLKPLSKREALKNINN